MRYRCSCGKVTALIKPGSQIRRGSVVVCQECLAKFAAAHGMAERILRETREDSAVEELLGKFGMGRDP